MRRQRRSSLEGDSEYAFAHALVRDVAYRQIPRADRAAKHRARPSGSSRSGGRRITPRCSPTTGASALELVRASGSDDAELAEKTRVAFRDAGDRTYAFNSYRWRRPSTRTRSTLWPEDTKSSDLRFFSRGPLRGERRPADQSLETARDALLAIGETDRAGDEALLIALSRGTEVKVSSLARALARRRARRRLRLRIRGSCPRHVRPHASDRRRDGRRTKGRSRAPIAESSPSTNCPPTR